VHNAYFPQRDTTSLRKVETQAKVTLLRKGQNYHYPALRVYQLMKAGTDVGMGGFVVHLCSIQWWYRIGTDILMFYFSREGCGSLVYQRWCPSKRFRSFFLIQHQGNWIVQCTHADNRLRGSDITHYSNRFYGTVVHGGRGVSLLGTVSTIRNKYS
jgi:hypothetical protein